LRAGAAHARQAAGRRGVEARHLVRAERAPARHPRRSRPEEQRRGPLQAPERRQRADEL